MYLYSIILYLLSNFLKNLNISLFCLTFAAQLKQIIMKRKWLSELEHGEMFSLFKENGHIHNLYYAGGTKEDITKHSFRSIKNIKENRFYFCTNILVYSYGQIILDF